MTAPAQTTDTSTASLPYRLADSALVRVRNGSEYEHFVISGAVVLDGSWYYTGHPAFIDSAGILTVGVLATYKFWETQITRVSKHYINVMANTTHHTYDGSAWFSEAV